MIIGILFAISLVGIIFSFLISMVLYFTVLGCITLVISICFFAIFRLLVFLTKGKIYKFMTKRNLIIISTISILLFLIWYFIPVTPQNISKDKIEFFTITSYLSNSSQTYSNPETIDGVIEFLNSPTIHRSIKRFKKDDLDKTGFIITFYDKDNNKLKEIQIAKKSILKADSQYYNTYFFGENTFDEFKLQNILNNEISSNLENTYKKEFFALKESLTYQNNILKFKIPNLHTENLKIESIRANIETGEQNKPKQTVYFLKETLKDTFFLPGDDVKINLKDTINNHRLYDLRVTLLVNNVKVKLDLTDYIPSEIRIKDKTSD